MPLLQGDLLQPASQEAHVPVDSGDEGTARVLLSMIYMGIEESLYTHGHDQGSLLVF